MKTKKYLSELLRCLWDKLEFESVKSGWPKLSIWWKTTKPLDLHTIFYRKSIKDFCSKVTTWESVNDENSLLVLKYAFFVPDQEGFIVKVLWKNKCLPLHFLPNYKTISHEIADEKQIGFSIFLYGEHTSASLLQVFRLDKDECVMVNDPKITRKSEIECLKASVFFSGTFLLSLAQRLDEMFNIHLSYLIDGSRFEGNISARFLQTAQNKVWFYTAKGGYLPTLRRSEDEYGTPFFASLNRLQTELKKAQEQLTVLYQHPFIYEVRQSRNFKTENWKKCFDHFKKSWFTLHRSWFSCMMYKIYV
jgi:hypothetical protein